jgi:hypothetical protein
VAQVVRFEVFSDGDAGCLIKALLPYEAAKERLDGYWEVLVEDDADPDGFLADVIQAVLGCFADGRVRGFVLDTGDYRLPVGDVPAARSH